MTYPNAAAGLKTVFQSQIVGLAASVLLFIPLVNFLAVIALLVAFVLYLIGLNQCAKQDEGYKTAFTLVIVNLVVNLLGNFIPGAIGTILSLVGDVLSLAALYFVCTTTNRLLGNLRAPQQVIDRGIVVWKINVICTIVAIVCELLSMIPVNSLQLLASIVSLIAAIAQVVGTVLYVLFLRDAYRVMERDSGTTPDMYVGPEL